jgi:hypothetical protein
MEKENLSNNINSLNNGLVQDINRKTSREYSNKMNPSLFDNHGEYSLKGIVEQSPISQIFFSPMNVNGIQDTIRYRVYKVNTSDGVISPQSENEMFIIMRSIYLQYGNSMVLSDDIIPEIRGLNEKVISYCVDNISSQLKQYKGYRDKVSKLPVPLEHPIYDNKKNFTYDSSNLL